MSEEWEKTLAGLFMVGFSGVRLPLEVARLIERGLGGVILFRRNLPDVDTAFGLLEELFAAAAGRPLVVAVDQEGGPVQRLGPPVLQLPPMRTLGLLDDEGLCHRVGEQLGAELAALGFHLNLAPVLDVDSNPDNPVIAKRAFGSDARAVARLGLALARGLNAGNVANCGKHFPGHGDTDVDSHQRLPRLAHSLERLRSVELVPFARAADGLDAVMVAHLAVDALEPERACSLSAAAYQLLREEIGFDGLVLTDDLQMGAVAEQPGVVDAACQALLAGADGVLICHQPELASQALQWAAERFAGETHLWPLLEASRKRWKRLGGRFAAGARRPSRERFDALIHSSERLALQDALQSSERLG